MIINAVLKDNNASQYQNAQDKPLQKFTEGVSVPAEHTFALYR
jgi:hypothetical protein